jgi:hypothetical protein
MAPHVKSGLAFVVVLGMGIALGAAVFSPDGGITRSRPASVTAMDVPAANPGQDPPARALTPKPSLLPGEPPTPEQALRSLEDKFQAEPPSASWARFNEAQINAALSDEALAKEGIPPLISDSVECRSSTCRIELHALDDPTTAATPTALLQAIADNLNTAQIVYLPSQNGDMAMAIYARNSPVSTSRVPHSGQARTQ